MLDWNCKKWYTDFELNRCRFWLHLRYCHCHDSGWRYVGARSPVPEHVVPALLDNLCILYVSIALCQLGVQRFSVEANRCPSVSLVWHTGSGTLADGSTSLAFMISPVLDLSISRLDSVLYLGRICSAHVSLMAQPQCPSGVPSILDHITQCSCAWVRF
jgi:hypothetical protein